LSILNTTKPGDFGGDMAENDLKRTPLYKTHLEAGARLVEFGGWEMPVQYTGIVDEHLAVRNRAGIFDVSHMGEFEFSGSGAALLLQHLCCNNLEKLDVGKAQYSMFLNHTGGTVDDIMIYRTGESKYLVVVNASNIEKDWAHVQASSEGFDGVDILNRSDEFALLALQGPDASGLLEKLGSCEVSAMPFRAVLTTEIAGKSAIVSTTGYTGENGFEIFVDANKGEEIWHAILEAGEGGRVSPAGLGSRDTLRLEASLPLYGHELDEETSPIEAGLGMFVARKREFVGSEASVKLRKQGIPRKLAMLEMIEKGIPRQGYPICLEDGTNIGQVTSGSVAPFFNTHIAMGYVSPEFATPGQELMVNIRNRPLAAKVVSRPYYKRPKK
jgi:aminomethyltransferase